MKKSIFFFALLILAKLMVAQIANRTPNLVPQTPNNASLFKYTETPVSYYNGTTNISLPIYEIVVDNVKIPIALSYHPGGIKVNEEASWVGLGWNLSGTGVISQIVVGTEDNKELANNIQNLQKNIVPNLDLSLGGSQAPMNLIEKGVCFPDTNGAMHSFQTPDTYARLANSDRQFDLYVYNFNNYSGKLINPKLNYYNENRLISLDNTNIRFIQSDPFFNSGSITAITPDGTKYLFGDLEKTQSVDPSTGSTNSSYSRYLTSITTPEGHKINFTYKTINTYLIVPASESYYSVEDNINGTWSTHWEDSRTIAPTTRIEYAKYLSSISWDDGNINFTSDPTRDDLAGGYKLLGIRVTNKNGVVVKKADFSYDYFTGALKYGDYLKYDNGLFNPWTNYPITDIMRKKRLKLLSVKIDDLPAYTFGYNNAEMPYKTAFARDLWDYFNGVNFDLITYQGQYQDRKYSLLPDPTNIGYYDASIAPLLCVLPGITFGQRKPDATAMLAGMLTQITYPTGGHTDFEFEANQFAPPDGAQSSIVISGVEARDGNTPIDIPKVEFTIPTVNTGSTFNNGSISIRLSCGGCTTPSGNGCLPYDPAYVNDTNMLKKFLYVSLDLKDATGETWTNVKRWDYSCPEIVNNNGVYTTNGAFLQGRKYRITANYPINCDGDYYGTRAASIKATYFAFSTNPNPIAIGGGVRVKTITDYTKDNQVAIKRKFTYENGVLMTKPAFVRFVTNDPITFRAKGCYSAANPDPCAGCDELGSIVPIYAPGTTIPISPRVFSGYYSEPTVPYSYSANGSPVGYGKVTMEYVGQIQNGKTEYVYNNTKDRVLDDAEAYLYPAYQSNMNFNISKIPGIPPIKDLLNGMLKSQTVFKNGTSGYTEVQRTDYNYRIDNKKTYWGYKTEYAFCGALDLAQNLNPECNVLGSNMDLFHCIELASTSLYFYPLTRANVNLISKTEKYTDAAKELITTTRYEYNTKNQLQKEKSKDSKGNVISKETYFVNDRQADGPVLVKMLKRNMLDYTIEQINKDSTQSLELSKTKSIYNYSIYTPDTLILPSAIQTSLGGNALENSVTYDLYDNKGNVLQSTSRSRIPTSYVWAYNQLYPVAKIEGATYAQVLTALSQTDKNLPYLQTMTDLALETELNKIRINLKTQVPLAFVSTYIYRPLVGILKAVDSNGQATYYDYDSFGRLKLIKDNDGKIIKQYQYHYQNQQ